MRQRVEERDQIIGELRDQVQDLENRNRCLNDKVNEVLYSKAAEYKNKTIQKLKQSAENVEPNTRGGNPQVRDSDVRFAQTL